MIVMAAGTFGRLARRVSSGGCPAGVSSGPWHGSRASPRIRREWAACRAFVGLRFPVASVVAMIADGMSDDEILAEHPDREREDIREALRFAALAVQERELPLRQPA